MAFGRLTTASLIKPLEGAIIRRGQLGATVLAGEIVFLQSDGKWDPAVLTAATLTARIAVQGGVDGDEVDMVTYGPVLCIEEGTIGALVYGSDTAGEPSLTAGTKSTIVGYCETAAILFVQPQIVSLT